VTATSPGDLRSLERARHPREDASYADYAKEYKILQARGVAAYKRVLRV
jgi:hypothetical protein